MSNINQSSDIESENIKIETKVLESRKNVAATTTGMKEFNQPKEAKVPSSTNNENMPNGKVPKKQAIENAPRPKRESNKQITKSKQPTIDDFVNTLMRYEKNKDKRITLRTGASIKFAKAS